MSVLHGAVPRSGARVAGPDRRPAAPRVHLVGAGPGDPELLTLKAARLLREADLVLHDRLVSPEVLELAGPRTLLEYVGKRCGDHHVAQRETERRMIAYARAGLKVVRLKGGDPFVFGRGGEEVQALLRAGVAVEVVPGITAGVGCAAAAGIPLTHRDVAHACVFLTGRELREGLPDWSAYARGDCTLVIYMGLGALAGLCTGLRRHGLPATWPVALIEHGTTPAQRVVRGTLADIAAQAERQRLSSPALAIVGRVVELSPAVRDVPDVAGRARCPVPDEAAARQAVRDRTGHPAASSSEP